MGVETTTGPLGQGVGNAVGHGHGGPPRSAGCSTRTRPPASRPSTTRSGRSARTATSRRASAPRPRPSPAPSASATSSWSGTTTASRSRTTPRSPSPRTSPRATRRTAGTSSGSASSPRTARTTRTSRRWPQHWRRPGRRPSGRRSSRCARSSAGPHRTSRAAARRTARPSARTRSPRPRRSWGWTRKTFEVPDDVLDHAPARSSSAAATPRPVAGALRRLGRRQPRGPGPAPPPAVAPPARRLDPGAARLRRRPEGVATRKASGEVLNALAPMLPELWGGSADLAESNNTTMKGEPSFLPEDRGSTMFPGHPYGRTLHFGVREHAMGSIMNGIALHGGTRVYGGTFLVFSDYMRGAVRLAAIMGSPVIYVWTHDSIGLGEDGPTHQPVEHLASLRAMPGLDVVRPADANETAVAWRTILEHNDRPAGLCLTRQNVPTFDRSVFASAEGVTKGAYVLRDAGERPSEVILMGTGSEVQICVAAQERLEAEGMPTRVVSVPCVEWFPGAGRGLQAHRPAERRPGARVRRGRRVAGLARVGRRGRRVRVPGALRGIWPYGVLYEQFGFTAERVVSAARSSRSSSARPRLDHRQLNTHDHDADDRCAERPDRRRRRGVGRRPVPVAAVLGQSGRAHRHQGGRRRYDQPVDLPEALSDGAAYDDQVRDLALRGTDIGEAVRALTTYDVRWACDVMREVYDRTDGVDGRVSIEVDPRIAHDADRTVAEAKALWWLVDRPNLYIKIPATKAACGDHSGARRGSARQRHAHLQPQLRRRHGRLPRRSRAGEGQRPRPGAPGLGGVVLRQPGRHRDRPSAADDSPLRGQAAPTPGWPTSTTRTSSPAVAGRPWRPRAPRRSARCGPPPASRTRATTTRCTSSSWSRRAP